VKLQSLKARAFAGLREADVTFDTPVTLFIGGNNQGKSSVRDAILFGLTGKARAQTKYNQASYLQSTTPNGLMEVELAYQDDSGADCEKKRTKNSVSLEVDDRPLLRYCLNPHEFIALPARDRGGVLADVLGGGMEDVIKAAIITHIGSIDETLLAEIKADRVNVLDIEALKAKVVECRRQYKRDKSAIPELPPLLPDFDLDIEYNAKTDEGDVEKLAGRIAKGGQLIAEAKRQNMITAEIFDAEKQIEKLKADKRKVPHLPKDVNENDVRMAGVYCSIVEDLLANTEAKTIKCPLSNTGHSRESLEARQKELGGFLSDHQGAINSHDAAVKHNESIAKQLEELEAKLGMLKKNVKAVDLPNGSENLLGDLTKERDGKQRNLANYDRYMEAKDQFTQGRKRRNALQALIVETDRVDIALKDGGPVKSAIAAGGKKLPINEKLLKLWGMEALEWSDAGEIWLRKTPIEYASTSEQFRAACVMGMALADISGIKVAAIDGFDILLKDNRNAFMQVASECGLNNVLLFCSTEPIPNGSTPKWLEIFKVVEGKVVKV